MSNQAIYMADFETHAPVEREDETWVWAWGITNIFDEKEQVDIGNSIDTFFHKVDCLSKKSIIYFHNLGFDGRFILAYLELLGLTHVESGDARNEINKHASKKPKSIKCVSKPHTYKHYATFIDDCNKFFTIHYLNKRGIVIEFRDSLKKINASIERIGKSFNTGLTKGNINYNKFRSKNNYTITAEEKEYITTDILIAARAMKILHLEGLDRLTTSADAYSIFMKQFTREQKGQLLPVLPPELDAYIRKAYKGGWVYVKKSIRGVFLQGIQGMTFDVNSLYPFAMHSDSGNRYPFGAPIYAQGELLPQTNRVFIQRFKATFILKTNHLPTIQIKNSSRFSEVEYVEECLEPVELTLTHVDLQLLKDHYNILSIEYLDGYYFNTLIGVFDDYIDKYYDIKQNSTGAKKETAKLMLNGLTGKFAQKLENNYKVPYLSDGVVNYRLVEEGLNDGKYIPITVFILAYARNYTIRNAQKNYNNFCYADTDSLHLLNNQTGLDVDSTRLGAWKNEGSWTSARFIQAKRYLEINDATGDVTLKCAGMTPGIKDAFIEDVKSGRKTWDDFNIGLTYLDLKLKPTTVKGGVILLKTPFTLK